MFGRIIVFGLAVCLLSGAMADAKSDERPNFLVILCDDLGYGDLACYGNRITQTPHLEKDVPPKKGKRIGKYDPIRRAKLGRMELYNLRNDSSEQHDLSQTETVRMEPMVRSLRAKYQEVIAEGPLWKTK